MLLAYEDALAQIMASVDPLGEPFESVSLAGVGPIRVVSQELIANDPHPRFDNASVDGYAIHGEDLRRIGEPLSVATIVAAGEEPVMGLSPGISARIFTGAQLPSSTAAVGMQEYVDVDERGVTLQQALSEGDGLRRAGTDFESGAILLTAGTPITPGVTALLASQGEVVPKVFRTPNLLIITTGDEIVPPEKTPQGSELRDVIASMLGLAGAKYATIHAKYVPDEPMLLAELLEKAARDYDAIFVAGGASVGDRDYLARVVEKLGEIKFHGINVRPGKPLLFGKILGKPILGLPGNPASAYVCFQLFGVPLLRRLGGWNVPELLWFEAALNAEHEPESRDVFARVTLEGGVATPVHEQASYGLRLLGAAQALARLPGGEPVRPGDKVAITLLGA